MEAECYFHEFPHGMRESGSLVEQLIEGLTKLLYPSITFERRLFMSIPLRIVS
jgi:hypothetical protein